MFTVVANAEQLRKALKDIEKAEANGFMYPTNRSLDWGRGQGVTERNRFEDGKLISIK